MSEVAKTYSLELKALAATGTVGFIIGVGITFWVRYTLAAQGIYRSAF